MQGGPYFGPVSVPGYSAAPTAGNALLPLPNFSDPARDQFMVTPSMVIPEADWEAAFAPSKPVQVGKAYLASQWASGGLGLVFHLKVLALSC